MMSHINVSAAGLGLEVDAAGNGPAAAAQVAQPVSSQMLFAHLPAQHVSEGKSLKDVFDSVGRIGAYRGDMHEYQYEAEKHDADREALLPYWGQAFVHGFTNDLSSKLEPFLQGQVTFAGTPLVDLYWLYGLGPKVQPANYASVDGHRCTFKLVTRHDRKGNKFLDVCRLDEDACIGDHRNDENPGVAAVHLAWMAYHNAVAEQHRHVSPHETEDIFDVTRTSVIEDYHTLLLNYYLPKVCDPRVLAYVKKNGPQYWTSDLDFVPLEYNHVLRAFHSTCPAHIPVDSDLDMEPIFSVGNFNRPEQLIDLRWLAPLDPEQDHQRALKIDTEISWGVMKLPDGTSLAARNLQRGVVHGLPSFTAVEQMMLDHGLIESQLVVPDVITFNGLDEIPFWYGILLEAELKADGQHLGPVGSFIMAECTMGLMKRWPGSPLNRAEGPRVFTINDWWTVVKGYTDRQLS